MEIDLNTPEKIAGAIGAFAIILLFIKRVRGFIVFLFNSIRNIILVPNSLHAEFGSKTGAKISKSFREFAESAAMDRLEMEILHREIGIGIYICSSDGRCSQVNHQIAEMFGLGKEEMLGYGWLTGILEEDRIRVHSAWNYAISNDTPYKATYTVKNARTGATVKCITEAWPKKIDGVVIGYCGFIKEIKDKA